MPFPTTLTELKKAGYVFQNETRCRCGQAIEWWLTPRGKMMPVEVDGETIESHWANCPHAGDFRK
jgi:hypothetical protein